MVRIQKKANFSYHVIYLFIICNIHYISILIFIFLKHKIVYECETFSNWCLVCLFRFDIVFSFASVTKAWIKPNNKPFLTKDGEILLFHFFFVKYLCMWNVLHLCDYDSKQHNHRWDDVDMRPIIFFSSAQFHIIFLQEVVKWLWIFVKMWKFFTE